MFKHKTFSQIRNLKILVVGDLILDEYIWGNVERISPEAPVQVLESKSENYLLGGVANVAHNLLSLGSMVFLIGLIGQDDKGDKLIELLIKNGINIGGVFRDKLRPTTNKIRVIAHNQQILRIDKEEKNIIFGSKERQLIKYIRKIVPEMDGIVCSDYQKGVLTPNVLKVLIKEAKKNKKMIFVDPKGRDYTKYKGVDFLTPNEAELKDSLPFSLENKDIKKGAEYLLKSLGAEAILVTRGREGISLFEKNNQVTHIPTQAKEVYDVTGAGDTVISVFALSVISGLQLVESAHLANKAAGIVVGKVGTATVSKKELFSSLEEEILFDQGKILSLAELKQIVAHARERGEIIVFTNGCFDLLHIGHIQYLKQAKRLGNILIVALNDDKSVRKLKGAKRPLIKESERAHILASLDCIDYIVLFSELTPRRLIQILKPDILVKGGDYSPEQVVGKDLVENYGGRVEIISIVEGKSTSNLVKTIVKKYRS